jgi:hypothetical protein
MTWARLEGLEPPTGCLEGGLRPRREQPRRSSQAIFTCPRLTSVGHVGLLDRARSGHDRCGVHPRRQLCAAPWTIRRSCGPLLLMRPVLCGDRQWVGSARYMQGVAGRPGRREVDLLLAELLEPHQVLGRDDAGHGLGVAGEDHALVTVCHLVDQLR